MKRSIATAAGAGVASVGMTALSVVAAGTAAHAVPPVPLEQCATYADLLTSTDAAALQNPQWYMGCIPQYGLGKAEFTVSSDVDFPADFVPFGDSAVTQTSSVDSSAVDAYFGTDVSSTLNVIQRIDDGSNPKLQRYRFGAVSQDGLTLPLATLPISQVGPITSAELPAECLTSTNSYQQIFAVDYTPFTLSFAETAGDYNWTTTVDVAPPRLYVAFTVLPGNENLENGTAFCVGNENQMVYQVLSSDQPIMTELSSVVMLNPYSAAVGQNFIGDFPMTHELANTGQDQQRIGLIAGIAGALIVVGIAIGVVLGLRRRKDSRSPRA